MMHTTSPTPAQAIAAISGLTDLYSLQLVEGIPAQIDGKTIRYTRLTLRETAVADERLATQMAERVVPVQGRPTLLVSDADFRLALTMRHCATWHCDGIGELSQEVVNMDVFGKLNPYDLARIEDRIMLISLAAQARYGIISMGDVAQYLGGNKPPSEPTAPQPVGQTAGVGSTFDQPESGPSLLAEYAGNGAAKPTTSVG